MSAFSPVRATVPIVDLFIQGDQLLAACGKENQKRFNTLPYLVAKIMDIFAYIFPCFFLGAAEIRVETNIYFIARDDIKKQLECPERRPCHSANALDNAETLKAMVQNYFTPDLHAIREENTRAPSATVPIRNPQEDAAALTEVFLALKNKIHKSSGYQLSLTADTQKNAWNISVHAVGQDGGEIIPPAASTIRKCTCCHTCYEHTLKTVPNLLVERLNKEIAPHDMFAVFSPTKNLLLIPDARKNHVRTEDFPHLFALSKEQLRNVFFVSLQADAFLRAQSPEYRTHIGAHIGIDGNQTVRILHVRFEKLPASLLP